MPTFLTRCFALVMGLSLGNTFAWADGHLINASFSSPSVSGVEIIYDSIPLPGWTLASGCCDLVNLSSQPGYAGAFENNPQAVDLNGYHGVTPDGSAATLYQDVPTTPGHRYTYTFGIAANTGGGPMVKSMKILWGDPGQPLHSVGTYSTSLSTFTTYNFTVDATSWKSRLELVSITDTMSDFGPYVCFSNLSSEDNTGAFGSFVFWITIIGICVIFAAVIEWLLALQKDVISKPSNLQ